MQNENDAIQIVEPNLNRCKSPVNNKRVLKLFMLLNFIFSKFSLLILAASAMPLCAAAVNWLATTEMNALPFGKMRNSISL